MKPTFPFSKIVLFVSFTLIFMAGLSPACVSDDGDSDSPDFRPRPSVDAAFTTTGIDSCGYCHPYAVSQWVSSVHANGEDVDDSGARLDLGLDGPGYPDYRELGQDSCLACHDEMGDGNLLVEGISGNIQRPVTGCESCHGGGSRHFGTGPIEYPVPPAEQCAKCHDHPRPGCGSGGSGQPVYTEWLSSPHSRSINAHMHDHTIEEEEYRARCTRCHTDEGYKKYRLLLPSYTGRLAIEEFFFEVPNVMPDEISPVSCRTCHHPHAITREQPVHMDETVCAGEFQSSQYNTCTSCHQLSGADGLNMPFGLDGVYHDPAAPHARAELVINDTHAAVPGDIRLSVGLDPSALYFVKKGEPDACTACHDPHRADVTINMQYARSRHGTPLASGWISHDFKQKIGTSHGGFAMQNCQRCHTSTGFKNYADALAAGLPYNPLDNDFSYLLGVNDGTTLSMVDDQTEALYCWACHSDNDGGLRDPGAVTHAYPALDGSTLSFPDEAGSNSCVSCHSGYYTAGAIAASIADFSNTGFITSHYLAEAQTLLGGAYGYPGRTYQDPYFQHHLVGNVLMGSTETALNGTNGPCVGCHMSANPEPHRFSPVTREGSTVTEVLSRGCAACHELPADSQFLMIRKQEFTAAMDAFQMILGQNGFITSRRTPISSMTPWEQREKPTGSPTPIPAPVNPTWEPVIISSL